LVLLVGPSGSGKSTWAARHLPPEAVLSSDHYRALVAGDAADQAASADAFKVLHAIARARLRRGLLTVVDATNLTLRARRALMRMAEGASRPAVAVVFDVSLTRCLRQNAGRPDRRVPDEVVRRQHRELVGALRQLPREGYHAVHLLRDEALAPA
jgi:predicted kinase